MQRGTRGPERSKRLKHECDAQKTSPRARNTCTTQRKKNVIQRYPHHPHHRAAERLRSECLSCPECAPRIQVARERAKEAVPRRRARNACPKCRPGVCAQSASPECVPRVRAKTAPSVAGAWAPSVHDVSLFRDAGTLWLQICSMDAPSHAGLQSKGGGGEATA